MASTKRSSAQATETRAQEDEKSLRSLRSLGSFITLGAWAGVLAGALFWCDRLLQQKRQLALVIYTYVMLFGWSAILIMRLVSSRPLFGLRDLLGLIVPAVILFEMHRLRQKGFLV